MSRKNKEWLKGIQHMANCPSESRCFTGGFFVVPAVYQWLCDAEHLRLAASRMRRELKETDAGAGIFADKYGAER